MKNKSEFFQNAKKMWKYMKNCKKSLIGYAIVSIVEAIIGVILPLISAKVILNITEGAIEQLLYASLAVWRLHDSNSCTQTFYYHRQ